MKRACIAVVDAAHARLYLYDGSDRASPGMDRVLREEIDLVNPGRRGHDLFSTTKPGVRAAPGGGNGGTTDDHRDAHFAELEHRFARQIVDEVMRLVTERGLDTAVVVAPPRMLGELRAHDEPLRKHAIAVEYVGRDLAQLTMPQIHDHLAQLHLIDPRPRQSFAQR